MFQRFTETTKDKGLLVPVGTDVYKLMKNSNKDYYTSFYKYNSDHKKEFDAKGSVAGFKGVVSDLLPWDFDNAKDPSVAQENALKLVYRLREDGIQEENIRIFFSGSKGFEVSVPTTELLTPAELKNVCLNYAEGLNPDTSVYNDTRIFRLPFTKHNSSGLFKIPLTIEQLESLTLAEIKEEAKSIDGFDKHEILASFKPAKLTKKMQELKIKAPEVKVTKDLLESISLENIDWSKKPRDLTHEKYLLSLGYFSEGSRSEALIILAATLKNLGWNETQVYYACKAAADLQASRTGDDKFPKQEIYKNIIEQVFGPNWKNGSYSVKDNLLLQQLSLLVPADVRITSSEDNIVSITESFGSFSSYAKEIDKNTIKFGIAPLDEKLVMQTGRLYGILAAPGVGKTTFGVDVLRNTSLNGELSMFASYDMSCPDVIQKLIQKHSRLKAKDIYAAFRDNDVKRIDQFYKMLDENYKNVTFIFKTGQTIDDLKKSIIEREKQLGAPIRLVVVDYLELIQSKFSDPTQASMESIQGLREIAVGMNKAVIVMLQPSKMGTSIDEPITSYSASKGSSSIAQAVTAMLTLHRPGCSSRTPENDNYIGIDCVKNRSGGLFSLDLHFDGATGNIRALEAIEAVTLQELREAKRQQNQDEDSLF